MPNLVRVDRPQRLRSNVRPGRRGALVVQSRGESVTKVARDPKRPRRDPPPNARRWRPRPGRVEDTFNLLGHAARRVVACVATLLHWSPERLCARSAGIPVLLEASVKKALDVDWTDPAQKTEALQTLLGQLDALERWIGRHLPVHASEPPLRTSLETLRQIVAQDLEPDPNGGGRKRSSAWLFRTGWERRTRRTSPEQGARSRSPRTRGGADGDAESACLLLSSAR